MNMESTRSALGISSTFGEWEPVNFVLNAAFEQSGDVFSNSQHYLSAVLNRGIRALIYVGRTDFSCNWLANLAMTNSLEWPGASEFGDAKERDWSINGEVKGMVKGVNNSALVFLRVDDAGHMVPRDKPMEALRLVNTWLSNVDF